MKRIKFNTIEDIRAWKQLKKDELDLEKLKLEKGNEEFKSDVVKKISKFLLFEVALVLGQKSLGALTKTLLKSVFSAPKSGKSPKMQQPDDSIKSAPINS